jgi:Legume-like lectin family
LLAAAVTALAAVHTATAGPMQASSFASPFSSYDGHGRRRAPGWQSQGTTRVKMGAVALTQPLVGEFGSAWTMSSAKLGDEFSFETKFRVSGAQSAIAAGGSLAWFMVKESARSQYERDWYGADAKFQGIAVVVDSEHPEATGDMRTGAQRVVSACGVCLWCVVVSCF